MLSGEDAWPSATVSPDERGHPPAHDGLTETAEVPDLLETYAKLLGMDADKVRRRLLAAIGEPAPADEPEIEPPSRRRRASAGAVVLAAAALAIGAFLAWDHASGGRPAAAGASGAFGSAVSPAAAAAVVVPESRVMLRARTGAWIEVRDSHGRVLLDRVMDAGETWQAPPPAAGADPLLLTTGNAGGTEVVIGGVVVPRLGPAGAVKRDIVLDSRLVPGRELMAQAVSKPAPARLSPDPQ